MSRAYCDPHEWRSDIATLAAEFGDDVVVAWPTSRDVPMSAALDRLHTDITNRTTWQDEDPAVLAHYGNAYTRMRGRLRLVLREYPNNPGRSTPL